MAKPLAQIKLTHLRLLAELDRKPHYGEAAERLGISGPAASRLAAEVEAIFGLQLSIRQGRGIALTSEGHRIAQRAARIISEIGLIERELTDFRMGLSGEVRVGGLTGPILNHVMPAVRAFRIKQPNVTIQLEIDDSPQLIQRMRAAELDFVYARPGVDDADLIKGPAFAQTECILVRQGHPLTKRDDFDLAGLAQFPYVRRPDPSPLSYAFNLAFQKAGLVPPRPSLTSKSTLTILSELLHTDAFCIAGLETMTALPVVDFECLPLPMEMKMPPLHLLTPSWTELTPAASALIDLLNLESLDLAPVISKA